MDKVKVDQIITEYLEKIYGFAVKKSFSYEEAEELSAEIVKEVYLSLLKSEEVYNLEGYVWRISEHTFSKYLSAKKRHAGVSLDNVTASYEETWFFEDDSAKESATLRREIAYLTEIRRRIVYLFYYKNRSISHIAKNLNMPEGTVKWHLNKARNDLKEGFQMERTIGKLGLAPVKAKGMGHSGDPGTGCGPETYLSDKLDLNIVYSVYHKPRTIEEIAAELGVTPVFIEEKIARLEANGYLIKAAGGKYTTYVYFLPEYYSRELADRKLKLQLQMADILAKEYAPVVRKAIEGVKELYIPSGNRELFEAAAIFFGIVWKSSLTADKDLSKYTIKDTAGGEYIAFVELDKECVDPEYQSELPPASYYACCGSMTRYCHKYPCFSWSCDTRLDSRKGGWKNNLTSDYEILYEYISGAIKDDAANAEKFARLRDRSFIDEKGRVQVMVMKASGEDFAELVPSVSEELKSRCAELALEYAMHEAKHYPPQMQDLVVTWGLNSFIGNTAALMVLDKLYEEGTFKPLTEQEKISSTLVVCSDVLPK